MTLTHELPTASIPVSRVRPATRRTTARDHGLVADTQAAPALLGGNYVSAGASAGTEGSYVTAGTPTRPALRGSYVTLSSDEFSVATAPGSYVTIR